MTINRKKSPQRFPVTELEPLRPITFKLDNELPVIYLPDHSIRMVQLALIFGTGKLHIKNSLQGHFCIQMLQEGSRQHNSAEIADTINYFGASLRSLYSYRYSGLILTCLSKHLNELLPLLSELVREPVFPDNEFKIMRDRSYQNYLIEKEKVRTLAEQTFLKAVYGAHHPSGQPITDEQFSEITPSMLHDLHQHHYTPDNCFIGIAGYTGTDPENMLNKYFGKTIWPQQGMPRHVIPEPLPEKQKKHFIFKESALQNAIYTGRLLFNMSHPDYIPAKLLTMILGGYFGSRLMRIIREKKGYTYGIHANIRETGTSGHFYISTETSSGNTATVLNLIYREMEKLCNTPVGLRELQAVKDYYSGTLLENINGPFALSDTCRILYSAGLPFDFYSAFITRMRSITPDELIQTARRYFTPENLTEVVAGK